MHGLLVGENFKKNVKTLNQDKTNLGIFFIISSTKFSNLNAEEEEEEEE